MRLCYDVIIAHISSPSCPCKDEDVEFREGIFGRQDFEVAGVTSILYQNLSAWELQRDPK